MTDLFDAALRPARRSPKRGETGYARIAHEAYFTEPWVTRALLAAVDFHLPGGTAIWEPACGDGRMARELAGAGYRVIASDLNDWGYGEVGVDFLRAPPRAGVGAVVTNPPFHRGLTLRFIARALDEVRGVGGRVAMLQRHEFDAPAGHHPFFGPPFAGKLVLPRRPFWIDDRAGGVKRTAGPRVPYAWFFWCWRHRGGPGLHYLRDPETGAPPRRLL